MIRGTKNFMLQWIMNPELRKKIKGYKGDDLVCDVMTYGAYKSRKQNSLFHGLLTCFWLSGCSSFEDIEALRDYYKKIAGLVYIKEAQAGNVKIIQSVEKSWSAVTKENATLSIKCLIGDMDNSGVLGSSQSKKYEEILKGLGEWFDEFKQYA